MPNFLIPTPLRGTPPPAGREFSERIWYSSWCDRFLRRTRPEDRHSPRVTLINSPEASWCNRRCNFHTDEVPQKLWEVYPRHQNDYMQLFWFSGINFLKITNTITFFQSLAELILEKCNSSWKNLWLQLHLEFQEELISQKMTLPITFLICEEFKL